LEAAYTSKKPGKTQQLNFYRLNDMGKQIYVVDSPGYGFASNASKRDMDSWKHMIHEYLKGPYVHRVICLFDSEHGLKATDKMLLKMLDGMYKQYILVATKSDKKNIHEKDFKTCK
jgi:GTP-binding protein